MAGNTSTPGSTVLSRGLALLFAFDDTHRRLTLSELARRAGLPLPTAHRLVGELVAGGALVRRPGGQYVIARRLWQVGLLAPAETGLRELAAPFMNDLHAATRATVHLAVREQSHVLYLERLSGRASVPVASAVGARLPLHATGVGKVLLAHAPDDVVTDTLGRLSRATAHTVTQPARIREQLERVRRDGYATTVEEMTLGACSVAVPITTGGRVVAALGMVVPSLERDRTRLVVALQVAAQGVRRSLDGLGPGP
ncbi:IclR family transcriptional regulator [Streptomyces beihaiensis]|uniref:IclR family transcriptional regulator n=1 Tax=Streptomyces beihaiensis TaxID=2984495 RepID=A0ABT3TNE7_9ACTN|nr:IclR family transcriptional regulator [Streptomyces beihaiensis]MCX3058583.1 IclR family transcriptional regulator [Streptomyces beihaiensis]